MRFAAVCLLVASSCSGVDSGGNIRLEDLDEPTLELRIESDSRAVLTYRDGLKSTVDFARDQTELFPAEKPESVRLPSAEERDLLRLTWLRFLDYLIALDSIGRYHRDFVRLSREQRARSYAVGYAAFLARYRHALEFMAAAAKNPVLDKILNEPLPQLGLPEGTYANAKYRYLNVAAATSFAARGVLYGTMKGAIGEELRDAIEADADFILKMGLGTGELLTVKNAWKIVTDSAGDAWFPVQAGVAEWMGDTKVYRRSRFLISPEQIEALHVQLEPGDILLTRREWYLSNIGLPGFWPHATLYIGTPEERRRFFADPSVVAWVRAQGIASGDLDALLEERHPTTYGAAMKPQEYDHLPRVLEAISEGVAFTTLEHSADADSLAALRPRLSKVEKAEALGRAFHYAGRPYDFDFDFATDAELVCTELVFKAYEPGPERHGLQLPLVKVLGRPVTPANEFVRLFDEQFGTESQQLDFITFLDGFEKSGEAVVSGVEEFRKSWKRPKWHVLTQQEEEREKD